MVGWEAHFIIFSLLAPSRALYAEAHQVSYFPQMGATKTPTNKKTSKQMQRKEK